MFSFRNRTLLFSTASIFAFIGLNTAMAQVSSGDTAPAAASTTAGSGSIAGRVVSGRDHKPLAGVQVDVQGTDRRAVTDAQGAYAFGGVPPGAYTIEGRTPDGREAETRVSVAPGATAQAEINTAAYGRALDELVVMAQRTPVAVARLVQKEAPNLVNIQTYQEIKKLPDISVAEAVRRVPGISLETDEGEGRYVNIRGLDADLNSTTFGGLRLPPTNQASPQAGYRAVTLDSIPTGLVGAITVTKTNLPDQDAEALGGSIEITPKTAPPGGGSFIQGDIGTGLEELHGTGIANVSVTMGTHFGDPNGFLNGGPFSIVLTGTYYEDHRHFDDVEPDSYFNDPQGTPGARPYAALGDVQQRDYELHRRRHGVGIDLGYEPNANNKWYVRAFEASYTERYIRNYLDISPDGNAVLLPNGQIQDTLTGVNSSNVNSSGFPASFQKALRDEKETSTDRVFVAGGRNIFGGGVIVDYKIGYTEGTYHKPLDVNSSFTYQPTNGTITYLNSGPGHVPVYTIAGADPLNPNNYQLAGISNSSADNFDRELSFAGNVEYPLHFVGSDESFKAGFDIRLRHKRTTSPQYSYPNLPSPGPLLTGFTSGAQETYYNGLYHNGPDIAGGFLTQTFGTGVQQAGDIALTDEQYLDAKENVYAGYGEYKTTVGRLSIVGGVRVEATEDTFNAFNVQKDPSGNFTETPITSHKSYVNAFPSVQLRFEIQPDFIARAVYSTAIGRPGFNQTTATTIVDFGSLKVTQGNPNLKPITGNDFDVSLEKYLGASGIISAGFFYKDFSNYVVPTIGGTTFISGVQFQNVSFVNAPGSAYALGVELNLDERFRMLPGFWSGFGVSANYTYVDSRVQIRRLPGLAPEYGMLPSTSPHTWNAAIFYEKGPVGLRLAAYSASADLFTVGGDKTSDVYNATRTSMDFGANYAFRPHWLAYFNAKNLLDTPHAFYMGTKDRPIQREFYGQTYQIGFRFDY